MFIYPPDSNITIKFKASNIERYYQEFLNNANKYIYEIDDNEEYAYLLNLYFGHCQAGEIFISESNMYIHMLLIILI